MNFIPESLANTQTLFPESPYRFLSYWVAAVCATLFVFYANRLIFWIVSKLKKRREKRRFSDCQSGAELGMATFTVVQFLIAPFKFEMFIHQLLALALAMASVEIHAKHFGHPSNLGLWK